VHELTHGVREAIEGEHSATLAAARASAAERGPFG
jgi:hypothetical protein